MKNDRMHELYASACLYAREQQLDLTDKNVLAFVECMAEKFAQLIIAECCVTADANIDDSKYPSYWIKKKFGVK